MEPSELAPSFLSKEEIRLFEESDIISPIKHPKKLLDFTSEHSEANNNQSSRFQGRKSKRNMEDILKENQNIREKLEQLRRDHNELIIENSFMKKENETYDKKLKEEQKYRESLHAEIKKLLQKLESYNLVHRSYDDDICNSVNSMSTESTQILSEQLETYREDFYAEKKARQKLKIQNKELENQLEKAKVTLERQQRKLLLYANFFTNPIRSKLTLDTSKNHNKHKSTISNSQETIQHYKNTENKKSSLMASCYKSKSDEHLLETSINNVRNNKHYIKKMLSYSPAPTSPTSIDFIDFNENIAAKGFDSVYDIDCYETERKTLRENPRSLNSYRHSFDSVIEKPL